MTENSTPAPAPKAKRARAGKKPLDHPKYNDMIVAAIKALNSRGGVSRQAIQKYIGAKYRVSDNANIQVKLALKKLLASGAIKQIRGSGVSGSFRLAKADEPKKAAKRAVKTPKKGTLARKAPVARRAAKATPKPKKAKVDKKKSKSPKRKKVAPPKKSTKAKPAKAKPKPKAKAKKVASPKAKGKKGRK
ncbi:histone H1.0-like [Scyliorhinus canicula]|uniref:histone H1.0-like n=1 Tax=Scyliorhinus canicula TaxID=7830 RepID=UPI0018F4DD7F|nr:histone H1.0-like [Scyliorhinus canicula]